MSGTPDKAPARLVVDGHVHIYDCFALQDFFRSAFHNLGRLAAGDGGHADARVLMLTEAGTADYFHAFRSGEQAPPVGFAVEHTLEDDSLLVHEERTGERCVLIAGRQIVTREDLEVLSLGSGDMIPDGLAIDEVIERVLAGSGIAALAWGVGKWLFGRGRVIEQVLRRHAGDRLFVGDNGGRPVFWGAPAQFRLAQALHVPVLAGSDPLPFAPEHAQVGTYGFALEAPFDWRHPAESVRAALVAARAQPRTVGKRDGVGAFLSRQGRILARKHLGVGRPPKRRAA